MALEAAARAWASAPDARLTLSTLDDCPPELDELAAAADPCHHFLRAAWYRAAGADRTIIARRAGQAVAAFPTVAAGPSLLGGRAVAGIYWPFRNVLLRSGLHAGEIEAILRGLSDLDALGPVWRLGPVCADDPAAAPLAVAARKAGWTALRRPVGRAFLLDLDRARAEAPWPRPSSLNRLDGYERRLKALGRLDVERISGAGWSEDVLDALAAVEDRSWIAGKTDGSGAKFTNARHRAFWTECLADPILARMLSVVLVRLDGLPIAFSFDLTVGTIQYGIAGTFDSAFAKYNAGKLANERNLLWSAEEGVTRFDWGCGDSGYKRTIGFEAGPELVDWLFVRNGVAARLLRPRWERSSDGTEADDGRGILTRMGSQAAWASGLAGAGASAAAAAFMIG